MLRPSSIRAKPFGLVADVLFQIITHGDLTVILSLCLVNRATYETIKMLEPHICGWFMRLQGTGSAFDPVLTMDPWTGEQVGMTIHRLLRYSEREHIARRLARHIVPTVWGAFTPDQSSEMDFTAELRLAHRLERGLYVLFHMSDISREIESNPEQSRRPSTPVLAERLFVLTQMMDEYHDTPPHQQQTRSFQEHASHVYAVLRWGYKEADIGRRRLEFRSHLDEQTQIDLHATLRMLRELTERMLLQHGPKDWHRDAKNEYSVISWFLLRQSPRSLAKLFLSPQDQCCGIDEKIANCGARDCRFADPLDQYWRAWGKSSDLGCQGCNCKRRVRSWSVKPTLIDARGREFNRAAERYLKDMWSQRHVGLHRTFTLGYFNTLLF
ncbi:SNARE domain protein [Aspergillus terreus]|uniref:SNARE domain protein n=1 Tax=Aspergillus terreus TaxID=33178 RepID=A0A5M3YSP6_ASPTE|nr:hypothetical protein ATETN484_0002025800 [Aspergillus terreus]GFF15114.1 SNARE domain protein [Aspergillus terreus]